MYKVSIIIPVYNVEEYIEQCVLSVINQTVPKDTYEVIIVNDGTKDSSMEIVNNIDWKGTNHLIINQTNQGLSAARNAGLSVASGDYIWFVDSDDWIERDSISIITPKLSGVDVLSFRSYYRDYDDHQQVMKYSANVNTGHQLVSQDYPMGAPFYIYSRDFLTSNNFCFKNGIFHEDTLFNPVVLYNAAQVSSCNTPLYHNRKRGGSITSSFNPKKIKDLEYIFSKLVEFQNNVVSLELRRKWGQNVLSGILLELLYLSKQTQDKEIINDVRNYINKKECRIVLKQSLNTNSRIIYYLSLLLGGDVYAAYCKLYKVRYR